MTWDKVAATNDATNTNKTFACTKGGDTDHGRRGVHALLAKGHQDACAGAAHASLEQTDNHRGGLRPDRNPNTGRASLNTRRFCLRRRSQRLRRGSLGEGAAKNPTRRLRSYARFRTMRRFGVLGTFTHDMRGESAEAYVDLQLTSGQLGYPLSKVRQSDVPINDRRFDAGQLLALHALDVLDTLGFIWPHVLLWRQDPGRARLPLRNGLYVEAPRAQRPLEQVTCLVLARRGLLL